MSINENLEINITVFVHSIPHLIYFIMGILIGYNYEQFKEKIAQFKIAIIINWFIMFLSMLFFYHFLDFLEVTLLNIFNFFYSISSIPFFFYIFTQIKSKFFNFNGNIAVAIFLTSPVVYTTVYFLFTIEERLFFIIPLIFLFLLNLKLWGSKFFYFDMKIAVGIFLVLPIVFTIFWNFVLFPFSSTFDYFILSGFSFFMTYMACLLLIAAIRRIPYYQYILTEIVDRKIKSRNSRRTVQTHFGFSREDSSKFSLGAQLTCPVFINI